MSSGSLFAQVAGLALVASVSPPALLLAGLYLRSERPGKLTFFFIVGGLVVVSVVGIVALVLIRAGGLSHLGQHQPRYGLRLGLGVIALAAAAFLYRRKPKPPDANKKPKKPNLVKRLSSRPSPVTAFAVGVFMFGPSVAFISAVQVVATAKTGLADTIGAMALIIVLAVLFAWLPFLAYLIAPDRTVHLLHSLEGALAKHGRTVMIAAVAAIGLYLTIQGITGLVLARRRPVSGRIEVWPVTRRSRYPHRSDAANLSSLGSNAPPHSKDVVWPARRRDRPRSRAAPQPATYHPLESTYHPLRSLTCGYSEFLPG